MATLAHLSVEIKGTNYGLQTFLTCDGEKAVRLEKRGGEETYDVVETATRTTCTCRDFEFRHSHTTSSMCKHVAALVELGLIQNVVAPIVAEVEPEATQAERSEAETEITATTYASEGLNHAITELSSEQAEQTKSPETTAADQPSARTHRVKRGRPRKDANPTDWASYGVRFAAGESYRKLAKEAGVPATRLYDRIKELGYSPAPAFAGV